MLLFYIGISSAGQLQGIFSSDGLFMNLNITNNFLTTKGAHGIAICGMLSGSISGNKNFNKTSALADNMIELYPLRIGGAHLSGSIHFHQPRSRKDMIMPILLASIKPLLISDAYKKSVESTMKILI